MDTGAARLLQAFLLALVLMMDCFVPAFGRWEHAPAREAQQPDAALTKMSEQELKRFANDHYWWDDYAPARQAIEVLQARSNCSLDRLNHECLELYMNEAVCLMQEVQVSAARSILNKLLVTARAEKSDTNCGMDEPDTLFFIAECDYRLGSFKRAEKLYEEALAKYRTLLPSLSSDLSPCIDGLVGCLCRRNDYADALPLFTELVRIDALNRGPNHLTTAWSLLNLTDVLNRLGRGKEAAPLFEKSVYVFRRTNFERLYDKYHRPDMTSSDENALKAKLQSYVFGIADTESLASGGEPFAALIKGIDFDHKPEQRAYDFYNWRMKRTKISDAPGLVTVNPNLPLKGLIICVHGLGLHHGTYQPFADRMSEKGWATVAFDVRGFGSYRENKGYDRVDLNNSVEDIGAILKLLRRDYPDRRMFLLGESMGGALALQVAAKYSQYLDGLVCSVPSGSRYSATTTSIHVAMKLLHGKDKPFDIGQQVVQQATRKEKLRKAWETDPEARLLLSPAELIDFQKFMNQNLKAAERLDKLPVIIFHGYSDKLVKPQGSFALYNALKTEDKDMAFIGHAEHLIFEEGQFKPALINGVNGWLSGHLQDTTSAPTH